MVDVHFLSGIPMFSSLSQEDMQRLATLWQPVTKHENQIVFKKGDPGNSMYLIRGGKVTVSVWTEDNEELLLSVLHEGDFFGELSLLDGQARTATVKVIEKAELLEMKRDDFLNFLRSKPEVAITMINVIGQRLRATNQLMELRTTRNVNEEIEQRLSFADRISDKLAQHGGSWGFIMTFAVVLFGWVTLNTIELVFRPFDPFPFIFLNLILSCISAIQAPIIMMSQNRQSEKDRLHAELDYQVNLKAELQIQSLHVKMDELRATELHELCELQREQIAMLQKQLQMMERSVSSAR